jgi:hypothetical protein
VYFVGVRFSCGENASILISGRIEAERGTSAMPQWNGSSGNSRRIFFLVKKTLRRHRAGFEPQRGSPFRKRVNAPQVLGEAARA